MVKSAPSAMERIRCHKWSLPSRIHWDSNQPRILFILITVVMIGVLHKTFSDNVADARINQLKPVLQDMNKFMENITSTSSIKGCLANYVKLEGYEGMKSPKDVASLLDEIAASGGGPDAPQKFIKTTIPTAPCG